MNPPTDAAEGTGLIRRCRRISSSISSLWILVLLLLLLPLLPPAQGTLAITHLSLLFIFFIKFTKFVSNPPRKCSICIPFQSKLSRLLLLLSSVFFFSALILPKFLLFLYSLFYFSIISLLNLVLPFFFLSKSPNFPYFPPSFNSLLIIVSNVVLFFSFNVFFPFLKKVCHQIYPFFLNVNTSNFGSNVFRVPLPLSSCLMLCRAPFYFQTFINFSNFP